LLVGSSFVVACGSPPANASRKPAPTPASPATLAHALAELTDMPPVYTTQASSLANVATWAIHATSDSPDAVIEGRDADGRSVVRVAEAYGAPSEEIGVAYWADSRLHTTFEAVRGAIVRDLDGPAGDIQPDYLITAPVPLEEAKAVLIKCTGHALLNGCDPAPCEHWVAFTSPDHYGGVDRFCYTCLSADSYPYGDLRLGVHQGDCQHHQNHTSGDLLQQTFALKPRLF
jgi:hypothetical protein